MYAGFHLPSLTIGPAKMGGKDHALNSMIVKQGVGLLNKSNRSAEGGEGEEEWSIFRSYSRANNITFQVGCRWSVKICSWVATSYGP